jgi:hypothetical protein
MLPQKKVGYAFMQGHRSNAHATKLNQSQKDKNNKIITV